MARVWTPEMLEFLRDDCWKKSAIDAAELVNGRFGVTVSEQQVRSARQNHRIKSGLTGHFPKGHIPFNKGMKGMRVSPATEFKKGQMPVNFKPVGSERVDKDGYIIVKVKNPKTWKMKHVVVWEQKNGKVPAGHAVVFADGNRQNCDINNLLLVSRAQLVRMNQSGLFSGVPEVTRTGAVIAELMTVIGQKAREFG